MALEADRGIHRNVVARTGRMRQCRARRRLSRGRIGLLGVSLAFGLTVLTMAYAVGPISGGHFNPAVSLGLWAGGRFPGNAARALHRCASRGRRGRRRDPVRHRQRPGRLRCQRRVRGERLRRPSPGKYSLAAALVTEVVMTFGFLVVILGSTHQRAPVGFAGIAIGLALTLIHLVSIPVTNTSVNPARSTGAARVRRRAGQWRQLWLVLAGPDRRRTARGRAVPGAARPERSSRR